MGNPRYTNGNARRKIRERLKAEKRPCHICGQPIDYSLPANDPWSFEVDEIVPISQGGDPFDYSNVDAAHRICNQRRGGSAIMANDGKGVMKPEDVAADQVLSEVWDAVAVTGRFADEDIPTLRLLCQWHKVYAQCVADVTHANGTIRLTSFDSDDNPRSMPQLATMKQASAEIRALNDQLGISPKYRAVAPSVATEQPKSANATLLKMVFADREAKERKAAGE